MSNTIRHLDASILYENFINNKSVLYENFGGFNIVKKSNRIKYHKNHHFSSIKNNALDMAVNSNAMVGIQTIKFDTPPCEVSHHADPLVYTLK
jgi:hypothetical protein